LAGVISGLLAATALPAIATPFNYAETANGDLSNRSLLPTVLFADTGNNLLTGETGGQDTDYISFVVGAGQKLTGIFLTGWNSTATPLSNLTFIAIGDISDGNGITSGFDSSQWDGFGLFNASTSLGRDILESARSSGKDFAADYGPGTYTVWLNETNGRDSYALNFQISAIDVVSAPEPAVMAGLLVGLGGIVCARRRKKPV
jgi:hypothetical protein